VVAWSRVSQNRGSRTAGIDSITRRHVEQHGVGRFLRELRDELKSDRYRPSPARERRIPKRDGRTRRLGIATLRDRVVQMALKLVLEPIYESEFYSSSYGFRPGRRAQDAIGVLIEQHLPDDLLASSCRHRPSLAPPFSSMPCKPDGGRNQSHGPKDQQTGKQPDTQGAPNALRAPAPTDPSPSNGPDAIPSDRVLHQP
jgi:hypothetical protein